MAHYTIEDIEILRQKSGISYEEAVNLLEYHNGSLARALVDLEKNGRIRDAREATSRRGKRGSNVFNHLFRMRVKATKGTIPIMNLSALFMIFVLLVAPWVLIIGGLVALVLGYRFSVERNSPEFSRESLENIVRNAGSNVRTTVFTIARDMGATQGTGSPTASTPQPAPAAPEPEVRSESPASGTTPVNVQFSEDGNIRVTETRDGFHEADIE